MFSSLHHAPTDASIKLDSGGGSAYWIVWWPNFTGKQPYDGFSSWADALHVASAWLSAVAEEHQTADLWAAAKQERAWLSESPSPDANKPFSPAERELITQHLRTIETYLTWLGRVDIHRHGAASLD